MAIQIGKYIEAAEVAAPRRKTRVFDVYALQTNARVGVIQWFTSWRRYNFFPDPGSSFDALCLRDIANFCEQLMQERIQERAKA